MILAFLLAQAAASPSPVVADARCLVAMGAMSGSDQADVARAGQLGAMYYYGKLTGRDPRIDLKASLEAASAAVQPDPRPDLRRCGAELQQSGAALQALGRAMQPAPAAPATTPRKP